MAWTQGVRRFEHEERLLALGKHPLEFEGRLRHGIAGHHETLDGRIRGYARGPVDAGQGEHVEDGGDPVPGLQHVQKDATRRRETTIFMMRRPLTDPVGPQRPGMIAYRHEHTTDVCGGDPSVLRSRISGRSGGRAALHRSIRESGGRGRRWPEGSLAAVYDPSEQSGLSKLGGPDAVLAFVPFAFFVQHAAELHLTPLAQADVWVSDRRNGGAWWRRPVR